MSCSQTLSAIPKDCESNLGGIKRVLLANFDDVTAATCLGRNKLNIYHGKDVFQFKGDKRFNALKYVNICYRCKNILRGEPDDQFLGI